MKAARPNRCHTNIISYVDVKNKIVEKITVTNASDFRGITIRFTDKTAMHFSLNVRMRLKPELTDWTTGDGRAIKTYPVVDERND